MPHRDLYGNATSTDSVEAQSAYDTGVSLFLGAQFGSVDAFQAAVTADPAFAVAQAGLARAAMMGGDMPLARAAIARAEELAPASDPRERQHVAAISLLLSGKPHQCREAVLVHVREYPRDAMVAQLCTSVFGLIGFSGKVGREADLLAFTTALLPIYGDDWWMMSMHAISLCETGKVAASRALMDRALTLNPANANAAHFKAHAQYEAGETGSGRAFLSDWLAGYDARSLLHGHLSWHGALWALQDGDTEAMWQAVDAGVGPDASHGMPLNILTDTAAILYRARLAGVDVPPERWRILSDYAARVFPETGQSFADMHAALSHAMAGQGDRLARIAETAQGFAGDLVRPVARAWGAIAREDWEGALNDLVPVLAESERLGGSRAQRDLLELTYANVLMKTGRSEEAARSLALRRHVLAGSPPVASLH